MTKNSIKMKTKTREETFMKTLEKLSLRYDRHKVWDDFITVVACTLSNNLTGTFSPELEEEYRQTISQYTKKEQDVLTELFTTTVMAIEENPCQDFLGEIMMKLKLNNKGTAQILTPYHIAEAMTGLSASDEYIAEKMENSGIYSVMDPSVGCGVMLIASAKRFRDFYEGRGYKDSWKDHIVLFGQDIDSRAVKTAYIQLTLLGVAAAIKVGNSLADPMTVDEEMQPGKWWVTPRYYMISSAYASTSSTPA